ncbi:hypothetical protein G7Z17_g4728 [Cylindrodendrum hubeiense]|uniref:Enoyl reductase (ER) domain-containing protein n=1 Tax=Cylindrodendrum hubeiense TaxID=595255 RepID=A0A9P5HDE2_9HYPO|nr:hypothetical protein G7Z17_g4728 [Cylindrodendrum hubeiense]
MKAYQYENAKDGLLLQDIPIPEPAANEVQIRVKAAGMCHSDCHIVGGTGDAWLLKRPITLGHEVAGIITKVGPNITGYQPGDRVAVSQICHPVEERIWTLGIGLGFDGGYAEYAVAPISRLRHIPEGVTFAQAAVATDALATSYHAVVVEAEAKSGRSIGIIGLGGLGMSGLAFAVLQGATVYGIDIAKAKLEEAKGLGASECFESLEEANDVVFDVIVDFAGTGATTVAALSSVKEGGKVVVVGLASPTIPVPANILILRTVTLVGSLGASAEDLDQVLKYLQRGAIDPSLIEVPFHEIPASIDILAKGTDAKGRFWADPSKLCL